MNELDSFFLNIPDKITIKEGAVNSNNEYLLTKDEFESIINLKIDFYKLEENNEELKPSKFGKYTLDYLKQIPENINFFFNDNNQMIRFICGTEYSKENENIGIFNFMTGPLKSGKSFTLLCLYRIVDDNYRLYLNNKVIKELEERGDFKKIQEIFFYEISKIFTTYDDYKDFSNQFFEKYQKKKEKKFEFKNFFSLFIEELDSLIQKDNNKYNRMIVIIDDFKLDERNKKIFNSNYEFLNDLYKNRHEKPIIHFTFISPINDNYINKCILFTLENIENDESISYKKIDNIIYYPFVYHTTCFYNCENKDSFNVYKNKILNKNEKEYNISQKYLDRINYSLFHMNNIKIECEKEPIDKYDIIANNYIKKIEEESNSIVHSFYKSDKSIFSYDYDEVIKYHNKLSNHEYFEYKELIATLNCIPMRFLNFYVETIKKEGDKDEVDFKYNVSYLYDFYKDSMDKYLSYIKNEDYDNDENKTGKDKGNILEDKVIDAIKNGYFKHFKPDTIIKIDSIIRLSQYSDETKDNYKKEIEKFEQFFSNKDSKLMMITQANDNAKKYDLAFVQKYKKGKFQFILSQITRKKHKSDMLQYNKVKPDCYNFSNFFSIFNDIEIKKYHFLFIFQTGIIEDTESMKFCNDNHIKFIKFKMENKTAKFYNSSNEQITDIVFDNSSHTIVDIIKNNNLLDIDNYSSSSEHSLLGRKREKINPHSQAKYFFGLNIYKKISKILGNKNFESSENYYPLKENEYFYIYYRKGSDKKKIYYIKYLDDGKNIIKMINKGKDSKKKQEGDNIVSENVLNEPGTLFKCFRIMNSK